MLTNPAKPCLFIFDLDGTLLDTLGDIAASMNAVLARHGLPQHSLDAYRYFVGDGMRELVRRALPETSRTDVIAASLFGEMQAEYGRNWGRTSQPYTGISELLDRLTYQKIPKAVLSNKPHCFTLEMTATLLGAWKFDAVVGVSDENFKKPDIRMALKIVADLGVPAAETFFVGDSPVDILTAKGAGMTAVGVAWGFRTADELKASGADLLISTPQELFSWL